MNQALLRLDSICIELISPLRLQTLHVTWIGQDVDSWFPKHLVHKLKLRNINFFELKLIFLNVLQSWIEWVLVIWSGQLVATLCVLVLQLLYFSLLWGSLISLHSDFIYVVAGVSSLESDLFRLGLPTKPEISEQSASAKFSKKITEVAKVWLLTITKFELGFVIAPLTIHKIWEFVPY